MLCVVTNRKLVQNEDFYDVIERVAKGKVDYLILREKDLDSDELFTLAYNVKTITDKYNVPLIINGNLEVAEHVNAYGCQLSYNMLMKCKLWKKLKLKIGVSVHSIEEAVNAEKVGVNYILAGHVFETDCKKGLKGRGLKFISDISNNICIPLIAIGGINESNVQSVIKSGASGVAIMSTAMEKGNVHKIQEILYKIRT
ncbi:thiamine phosphate synthase [Clostridium botulinum]|nr:thiamine phosphate synthase [Clostridium botulinum]